MSPIVFTTFATINEILFNFVFKIQGEQLFSWIDKEGLEHAMTLPNSACDNNDPIWKVDTLKVSDKGKLPIKVRRFQKSSLIVTSSKNEFGPEVQPELW
jgi:hypothetical protein